MSRGGILNAVGPFATAQEKQKPPDFWSGGKKLSDDWAYLAGAGGVGRAGGILVMVSAACLAIISVNR